MLDRLPVELLQHVLRLAAPIEYSETRYDMRVGVLASLCLVCKRVRDVAQPMLAEVSVVEREPDERRLVEGGGARGQLVKLLVLKLRYLHIHPAGMNCPSGLVLPNLLELSLAGEELQTTDLLETLLTTTRLPSLRALAVDIGRANTHEYGTRRLPPLPSDLLQQLDMLSIDVEDLRLADLPSLRPVHTLVDCHWSQLDPIWQDPSPLPFALRIYDIEHLSSEPDASTHYDLQSSLDIFQRLSEFAQHINILRGLTPGQLRILVLPDALRPRRIKQYYLVDQLVREFTSACQRSEVTVLWDPPVDWFSESRFSPVFRDWVEQQKQVEQAKE